MQCKWHSAKTSIASNDSVPEQSVSDVSDLGNEPHIHYGDENYFRQFVCTDMYQNILELKQL